MPIQDPATNNELPACLRAGITGGIGSGKSTVCQIFAALGIPVYYADIWAKWLIEHDPDLRRGITDLFGAEAYKPDGRYNRVYVARIAFADPSRLAALNALVHPAVERHSRDWHKDEAASGVPYTLKEAALMIESGGHRFLDALIVVTAPEELRIARVVQRDALSADEVRARMASQLPEAEKIRLADFTVVNDGAHLLVPQVLDIHRALLQRRTDRI